MEILPVKPIATAFLALAPQPGQVGDVGVDGVDRLDAGRRGHDRAHDARVARNVEVAVLGVAHARQPHRRADRSSMPHDTVTMRGLAAATSRMFSRPSGVSVAISTRRVEPCASPVAVLEARRGCCAISRTSPAWRGLGTT